MIWCSNDRFIYLTDKVDEPESTGPSGCEAFLPLSCTIDSILIRLIFSIRLKAKVQAN